MNNLEVVIVDYGIGNILSVKRGLEMFDVTVKVSSDKNVILNADRVVLPGVGAFANAMERLQNLKLVEVVRSVHEKQIPLLGICLGMQILFDQSEEFGNYDGLGIIPGTVRSMSNKEQKNIKVPHIGWTQLNARSLENNFARKILHTITEEDYFYFVHSYMGMPDFKDHLLATCSYGNLNIPAIVGRDSTIGCQFHPEKSGRHGLKILKEFCNVK